MAEGIPESRFNMWRAVVGVIHADHVVKPHEVNFILQSTRDIGLSDDQRAVLAEDIREGKAIETFYEKITSSKDKLDFFHLARAVSWSDGEFDDRERDLLIKLAGIAAKAQDEHLMQESNASFDDIYITGREAGDPSLIGMIKGLMGLKAAS